jgi:hypothetical protein
LTGAVICLAGLTSACSSGGAAARDLPSPTPAASASVTPSSATTSETEQILAQYRGFWQTLTPASRAPESKRGEVLGRYAADPALRSLLAGIAAKRREGQWYYGANLPRPRLESSSVSAGVAVVDDCQDSSGAGLGSVSSGQRITVGVERNHVVATLHRMPDGVWRVVFVSYPKTSC